MPYCSYRNPFDYLLTELFPISSTGQWQIPVAGYAKEDLTLKIENDCLVITGKGDKEKDYKPGFEYHCMLDDTTVRIIAKYDNGLLIIETEKPKQTQKIIQIE